MTKLNRTPLNLPLLPLWRVLWQEGEGNTHESFYAAPSPQGSIAELWRQHPDAGFLSTERVLRDPGPDPQQARSGKLSPLPGPQAPTRSGRHVLDTHTPVVRKVRRRAGG